MSFGNTVLPAMDLIRSIGGILGLRPYTVTVHLVTWSGGRIGAGTSVALTPTSLTNRGPDGTLYPVKVKQVTQQEAIASGGLYTNRDLRVGPITPPYPVGLGFDDSTIDPPGPDAGSLPTERIWVVNGPSLAANACFDLLSEDATSLHRYLVLRQNGRTL